MGQRPGLIPKNIKRKDLLRLTSCVTLLFYLKQFLHERPPLHIYHYDKSFYLIMEDFFKLQADMHRSPGHQGAGEVLPCGADL